MATLFDRGATKFEGSPPNATDGAQVLGQEYIVPDTQHGTGREVHLRAVRNSAGIAILPKMKVLLNALGTEIDGYTRLPEEKGPYVDELLPAAGVATNDICYVVVEGPALGLTSMSNYAADIAVKAQLNSQTAAASTSTTAGRVDVRALVAATADATATQRDINEKDGVCAAAISAALTNATNSDILMDVTYRSHI